MTAAFRLLANAFELMRGRPADESSDGEGNDLLGSMIEYLRQNADDPPAELKGVPDSFLDELERVPKKDLKPTDTCPICVNPFLEGEWHYQLTGGGLANSERGTDEYPLVVQLSCHKDHRFDLDCIGPWLKLNSTCPLDRKELLKKKQPPPPPADDEDGEYDDMYA